MSTETQFQFRWLEMFLHPEIIKTFLHQPQKILTTWTDHHPKVSQQNAHKGSQYVKVCTALVRYYNASLVGVLKYFIVPCKKIWSPYQHVEYFWVQTMIWLPAFGINNAHTAAHETAHGGCTDTTQASLHWKETLGEKSLVTPGTQTQISTVPWLFSWMLCQLSYSHPDCLNYKHISLVKRTRETLGSVSQPL